MTAAAASALGGVAVIVLLIHAFGADTFAAGLAVLTPGTVVLGLACGAVSTVGQAARWRTLSRGLGVPLGFGTSLHRCYEATFLNAVLPGGLVGDGIRTAQHRAAHRARWSQSLGSVAGERVIGTTVIVVSAAFALVAVDWTYTLLLLAVAAVLATLTIPVVKRLAWPSVLLAYGFSVVSWAALTGMFVVAALVLTPQVGVVTAIGVGAISLAAMSIPVNVAGWGPREGITAMVFASLGYAGSEGITASVGYGLLALISVLPGGLLLLVGVLPAFALRRTEVKLGADVSAEGKPADGRGDRLS